MEGVESVGVNLDRGVLALLGEPSLEGGSAELGMKVGEDFGFNLVEGGGSGGAFFMELDDMPAEVGDKRGAELTGGEGEDVGGEVGRDAVATEPVKFAAGFFGAGVVAISGGKVGEGCQVGDELLVISADVGLGIGALFVVDGEE